MFSNAALEENDQEMILKICFKSLFDLSPGDTFYLYSRLEIDKEEEEDKSKLQGIGSCSAQQKVLFCKILFRNKWTMI